MLGCFGSNNVVEKTKILGQVTLLAISLGFLFHFHTKTNFNLQSAPVTHCLQVYDASEVSNRYNIKYLSQVRLGQVRFFLIYSKLVGLHGFARDVYCQLCLFVSLSLCLCISLYLCLSISPLYLSIYTSISLSFALYWPPPPLSFQIRNSLLQIQVWRHSHL